MSRLAYLKKATTLHDLASLLGYSAKGLAYVVYGIDDSEKYSEFTIKKRSGGVRTICAPIPELKQLQRHLAHLLEECVSESDSERAITNTLSHGFRKKHSIMTNAALHRKRRYVFNLDLHDFFGTINFGRIVGFLVKSRQFELHPDVARIIAQIACHNAVLPQGGACSPVLSNIIAHVLDIKLMQLAAGVKCFYTRYADDLTFSCNENLFPSAIADRVGHTTQWTVSARLSREIERCGFQLNPTKTRMQFKSRRQDVTGIVVNKRVNVRAEYAKNARAMVDSLIKNGSFTVARTWKDDAGSWQKDEKEGTEVQLRGILSHIDAVRLFERQREVKHGSDTHLPRIDLRDMDGAAKTYHRFLFYTQFYRPQLPLIMCEGKTDNVYLRNAIRALACDYPELVEIDGKKLNYKVGFFNYSKVSDRILHLGGGTGDLKTFVTNYGLEYKNFPTIDKRNPVIVLIDNDAGSTAIFSAIKSVTRSSSPVDGSLPYYELRDNLYVVPIPKIGGKDTPIELYFDKTVRDTILGGKTFSGTDKFDPATQYGKHLFAEHVVKKNRDTINFTNLGAILAGIKEVLAYHGTKP